MPFKTSILYLIFFSSLFPFGPQIRSPIIWTHRVDETETSQRVLTVAASIPEGWHLYSQHNNPKEAFPTRLNFHAPKDFQLVGNTTEIGNCFSSYSELYEADIRSCSSKVEYVQKIQLLGHPCQVEVTVEYMACSSDMCIPSKSVLIIPID